jgi:hypothetical protein
MASYLKKAFGFITLLFITTATIAQTNDYKVRKCFGYQRDSCTKSQNLFYKVQEDSRSALFLKGQTSQTALTIYNGRDYRISLCWDLVLGSRVQFKLIDRENNAILYDNANDNYATEFEFTVTQTRDIFVEITVLGESLLAKSQGNEDIVIVRKDKEMGCVGVLIEHMITPAKGF